MKLYGVALSPFVRKAMFALEYLGFEYENEATFPGDSSPEFQAISPLGKIPILEHDAFHNAFTVADTSVICRYLDRLSNDKSLYPQDPQLKRKLGLVGLKSMPTVVSSKIVQASFKNDCLSQK
jgi:glutathione S-transferase